MRSRYKNGLLFFVKTMSTSSIYRKTLSMHTCWQNGGDRKYELDFWLILYSVPSLVFDSRMLCSSICESLRSLAYSNGVNFNQAALRAVLKPENRSSNAQATQISVRFVCVNTSSTLPFIAIFQSLQPLFGSLFLLVSVAV